ncbi:MAG: ATP-grasp domain-containing protein [Lachnospiraceae bacterium]|nr:ATP-grasp domain-containing protein [Lachnospiraceae bacterium]
MKFKTQEFIPVLLGGDINTYSVARAFYEQYQVKSYVFGKFPSGPSYKSKITEYTAIYKIDSDDTFLDTILTFSQKHKDKKIILIGCGDSYVALISKYKAELPDNIIAPYIDFDLMNSLQLKERFYELCDKYDIEHPDTIIFENGMNVELMEIKFAFPFILKPSNGVMYWEHPFKNQHKVYKIHNREELRDVTTQIYNSGYTDTLILQDNVPGNDEYMRVLTAYSGKDKKVKMMCLGHVLLEEHTPHGLGNHAVIITEPNEELMLKVKQLLEDLEYVGFSNFDIKYDMRDNKFKFFEINTRQGRSNYYVTGSGFNIAKYIVEEYIYDKPLEFKTAKKERLWLVVPKRVAYKYLKDEKNKIALKRLIKEKEYVNPVFLKGDNKLPRLLRMWKNHFSHYWKFKKYYR